MTTIVALRTKAFRATERKSLEVLANIGHELVVAADERAGPLETAPYRKASLTEASVWRLGLRRHPDMGWRCGDYCLYLLAEAFPAARHFWLIEPDMRYNFADPRTFFDAFRDSEADFISHRFNEASPYYYWRPHIEPFATPVFETLFGGIRISRRAILACLAARRRLPLSITNQLYPNDESLVATTLAGGSFECRTFSEFGQFTDSGTFNFARPISGKLMDTMPPDGRVYHPVLYGEDYLRKARHYMQHHHTAERLRDILVGIERELGEQAATDFAAEIPAFEDVRHAAP